MLPYGSRVATSRINFRLLSRDALTHEKRLSIVAGDPATRALAASAGLPVFSSVAEYEASVAGLEDDGRGEGQAAAAVDGAAVATDVASEASLPEVAGAEPTPAAGDGELVAPVAAASAAPVEAAETPIEAAESDGTLGLVVPVAAVAAAAASPSVAGETVRSPVSRAGPSPAAIPAEPAARHTGPPATGVGARSVGRGGIRTPWIIGAAILGLAILVAGVGAYLLLPSARVVGHASTRTGRTDPGDGRRRSQRDRAGPGRAASCRPRS